MLLNRIAALPGARRLWIRFPVGTVPTRVAHDVWRRPHYGYGVYMSADLATRLRLPGISVIECGVAGGKGLLELEDVARRVGTHFGLKISVFGFDSGEGMPDPIDYRDLPHLWAKGFYRMSAERLKEKLTSAELILGDLEQTAGAFARQEHLPIGFVAFDLDYYSSTKSALRLMDGGPESHLPRVYCYFDETVWPELACHNEYTGELCAIREFNEKHQDRKLCPIHMLRNMRIHPAGWNDQMYVLHDFDHPLYCTNLGSVSDTRMAL